MTALFVALGIMVLALLALLLWFVPRLLQQQLMRTSDESAQLREMLLDLLSEQEAVTIRQTQLGAAIAQLQARLDVVAPSGEDTLGMIDRINTLQQTLQEWSEQRNPANATLDGAGMRETIDEILQRIDGMQVQIRDTSTLLDDGVLLGVRQLSDRVHALQQQLETWIDGVSGQHNADTSVLQQIKADLLVISGRLPDVVAHNVDDESARTQRIDDATRTNELNTTQNT
jgi:chromosome segregation ATPase